MTLDPSKVDAALKLMHKQERILKQYASISDDVQNAADLMRDIIDPPGLRSIREMHEQLMAIADPPYLRQMREMCDSSQVRGLADMLAGITTAIDPVRLGAGISPRLFDDWKTLEGVGLFAGLKALMPAESLSVAIAKSWAFDVEVVSAVSRTTDIFKSLRVPDYAKELSAIAGISVETEKLLASLDVSHGLADLLNITDITRCLVQYQTDRLNRAYAGFGASVAHEPRWLASAPDFVRTAPADVVFAQARFVRTVTTHEEIEEGSAADEIWSDVQTQTLAYIEAVLPELNPRLMKSWEGAWDTARRRGPDWARQAASSLRFLLIETLEAVAPLDEVRRSNLPSRYVQNGQVLRLGQIHWLCEPVKNRTYGKVIRADLDSAMTIIEAMNEAVHRDDYQEIEDAFRTMAIRAAVALCNLLKLWRARN